MRQEDLASLYEDSSFFESGAFLIQEEPIIALETVLSRRWQVRRDGWWTFALPEGAQPSGSGWKVHVSLSPADLPGQLLIAARALDRFEVAFKVLSSQRAERRSRSKFAPPTQVGKTLVAYPSSVETLVELCRELDDSLQHPGGPSISGEARVGSGPVYVRYGAFDQQWLTLDGQVVPGRTSIGGVVADPRGRRPAVPVPVALDHFLQERQMPRSMRALPLERPEVLQRTGAGSVYAGLWEGVPAVVKEVRRRAGVDAGGATAQDRLRHEMRVLQRLSGTGTAPEPIELIDYDDSVLLVMSRLAGVPLHQWVPRHHPSATATEQSIEGDAAAYLDAGTQILESTRALLQRMHSLGVIHGDVSPQNLLVEGTRGFLIDFEAAALDGVQVATAIATPGFGQAHASEAGDLAAVKSLQRMILNPSVPTLLTHRFVVEGTSEDLLDGSDADLRHGFRRSAGRELLPESELRALLLRGIADAATPERDDRLFPGGVDSLAHPVGPLSVSHGAAGVLAALQVLGEPLEEEWVDWLQRQALTAPPIPGAGEGLHGVAAVLARLGRLDAAVEVLDRLPDAPDGDGSWATGSSGRALTLLRVHRLTTEPRLLDRAARHLEALLPHSATGRPGLLAGQSGICLSMLAAANGLQDVDQTLAERVASEAHGVLDGEPVTVDPVTGHTLSPVGRQLLPSLGEGIAARALALHGLDPAADTHPLLPGILEALRSPGCALAGLYRGRAGILAALVRWLPPEDPSVLLQRRRILWHTVRVPDRPAAGYILSDSNARAACDVATGSAGVLLALAGPEAVLDGLGLSAPV